MGREDPEVSLRLILLPCLLLGGCTSQPPAAATPPPSSFELAARLYDQGAFSESLSALRLDLTERAMVFSARIYYQAEGPSLGDPATALELLAPIASSNLADPETFRAEARLALDPKRNEPKAGMVSRLEAQCRIGRCAKAAILQEAQAPREDPLPTLIRTGRLLLPLDAQAAGECVERALPLARKWHNQPELTITGLHWTTATDELYADVLAHNRHLGHARGLYVKALTAYRLWPAQSAYTARRKRELEAKVAALDRQLFPK